MSRAAAALCAAIVLLCCFVASAGAGVVLTQKQGRAGCINSTGRGCFKGKALLSAEGAAISLDGRNVYVVSYAGNRLSVLRRSPRTGALSQLQGKGGCFSEKPIKDRCERARELDEPQSIAVSPDGRNVYVASVDSDAVLVFDRDPRNGALTQKAGAAGCLTPDPEDGSCAPSSSLGSAVSVAVSPDGRTVYVGSIHSKEGDAPGNSVSVFERNPAGGALSQRQGSAGCVTGTADARGCEVAAGLGEPLQVRVSPDGRNVYVTSARPDSVVVLDRNTDGSLAAQAGTGGCLVAARRNGCSQDPSLDYPNALAISPDGRSVYVGSTQSDTLSILSRDPATGALARLGGQTGCIAGKGAYRRGCRPGRGLVVPNYISVSSDGRSVYVAAGGSSSLAIFDRNAKTGALRQRRGRAGCEALGTAEGCRRARGLQLASTVLVSPRGDNVYVTGMLSSGVAIFDRRSGGG